MAVLSAIIEAAKLIIAVIRSAIFFNLSITLTSFLHFYYTAFVVICQCLRLSFSTRSPIFAFSRFVNTAVWDRVGRRLGKSWEKGKKKTTAFAMVI